MARLVPVLDLMNGQVVRAVGGRRDDYRPLEPDSDPLSVARRLLDQTGATELYVADLDAITRYSPILSPNWPVTTQLAAECPGLWLDYGHRGDFDEAEALAAGVTRLVLGTETTLEVGTVWHTYLMNRDHCEVMLSLDLSAGGFRCRWADDPLAAVADVLTICDGCRVLVLDVATVGGDAGPNTAALCRRLRDAYPTVELWTGGGVRNRDDVNRLADAGAYAVLVASALHAGTLP